jgi:hypothetical protein
MKTQKLFGLVFLALASVACGDDEPPTNDGTGGGGTSGAQCDEPSTEHDQLIHAPTDAAVVKKVPQLPDVEGP